AKKMFRARETGDSPKLYELSPAVAGSHLGAGSLSSGLVPQALCGRLLRRLTYACWVDCASQAYYWRPMARLLCSITLRRFSASGAVGTTFRYVSNSSITRGRAPRSR